MFLFVCRYKNRPNMTFDEAGSEPDQQFELTRDEVGVVEYTVKASKFNSISQICIHFPSNFGSESTKLYYIGLKGDFLKAGYASWLELVLTSINE